MKKPESSFLNSGAAVDLIVIGILWCLAVTLVNPLGDFPLNDDWSYGKAVKYLVEHSDFRPRGWLCMPLISQALWGALFCIPHGFSFTALRFSTLTLSFIGIVGFYVLIRQLHPSRFVALVCTLLLAFNPLYFALSNSFMTDVPFTTMTTFSVLFFVRYFRNESLSSLGIAIGLAVAATLCRQIGVAVPLAFTATFLLKHGLQKRRVAQALTPSVVVIGCWLGFNYWLRVTGRTPPAYDYRTYQIFDFLSRPLKVPFLLARHGWDAIMYLGCFLLPLLVAITSSRREKRANTIAKIALVLFLFLTVARFVFLPRLMPVYGNVLDPRGIGPFTLQDTELLQQPHVQFLSVAFWIVITGLSLFGAFVAVFRGSTLASHIFVANPGTGDAGQIREIPKNYLTRWRRALSDWRNKFESQEGGDRTIALFFLACAFLYLAPLALCGFFDRYLLPAVVFFAAFFAISTKASPEFPRSWQRSLAMFFVAGFAWYAVAGTRDYLTWNRTRWTALKDLQAAKITPERIDGGFEFNGWYLYDPKFVPPLGKSGWWVHDDEYLLCFGEKVGYETFKEYDYTRWLPPSKGRILVLKRKVLAEDK